MNVAQIPPWLCWLDLETTGLDAEIDRILELGLTITGRDLVEVAAASWLVDPGFGGDPSDWRLDKYVRGMHEETGLFDAFRAAPADPVGCLVAPDGGPHDACAVEAWACSTIADVCGTDDVALAGTGVAEFDRRFMEEQMPVLAARFHYRSIDVGNVRRVAALAGLDVERMKPHRALDDARAALAEARDFVAVFGRAAYEDRGRMAEQAEQYRLGWRAGYDSAVRGEPGA